jgi:hypothetical protein
MHLNINLASQKFEEVRQFFVRWGTALGAVALLTLLLIVLAWRNHYNAADLSGKISKQKEEIARLEKMRAEAERIESLPENIDVTQQKNFWNSQLIRRQFSWTQLLNDLQRIMPRRASVSQVQPSMTPDGRVKLKLIIDGEKHSDANQLVQRMEGSERFRSVHITDETTQADSTPGAPPVIKFGIEADYVPPGLPRPKAPTKEGL